MAHPSLLGLAFILVAAPLAFSMDLDMIYRKALEQSELLKSAQIDVSINEANRDLAFTQVKPRVTLGASGNYHLDKRDRDDWGNSLDNGVRTEFRQPLYDGGVTRAAVASSDALIKASKWDYRDQQQGVYLRTASLFYELLSQKKDLANLEEATKVYRDRIGTLSEREKIGRNREAEVLAARTQLELLLGSIATTKTNLNAAEEELAWLTGLALPLKLDDNLSLADIKQHDDKPEAPSLPSVEAAGARIEAAKAAIDLRRTDLSPRLDFIASHNWQYLDASDQGAHDFAFGLGLNWVLYDAGQVNAAVSVATFAKSKAEFALASASRQNNLNLSLTQRKLNDYLEQIRTYQLALKGVDKTLKVQQREFDSGLITNLELLTTLDQKLEIARNLDLAIYRAKLVYTQAQVYSGSFMVQTGAN